ncbi:MAG: NUDIX domain-containing protein [Flavobacteriales bacterium]|nr:NUDIX domain-containing protein [Leptospiraceae bacterium]MCB9336297.1 NUDIX domain-containing protein [Flavobacteriales bacterium]
MIKTVSIIIENEKDEILLQLRDDKPSIPFPNTWVLPGGKIENEEYPEQAIKREMKEEIELEIDDVKLIKVYEYLDSKDYVYYIRMNLDLQKTVLHEGQKIDFFSKEEMNKLEFGYHDRTTVMDFIETH